MTAPIHRCLPSSSPAAPGASTPERGGLAGDVGVGHHRPIQTEGTVGQPAEHRRQGAVFGPSGDRSGHRLGSSVEWSQPGGQQHNHQDEPHRSPRAMGSNLMMDILGTYGERRGFSGSIALTTLGAKGSRRGGQFASVMEPVVVATIGYRLSVSPYRLTVSPSCRLRAGRHRTRTRFHRDRGR